MFQLVRLKWNANVRGLVIFVPKVRGLNRLTVDGIILLGYRIQSEILAYLWILELQRFAVLSSFRIRILDSACEDRKFRSCI